MGKESYLWAAICFSGLIQLLLLGFTLYTYNRSKLNVEIPSCSLTETVLPLCPKQPPGLLGKISIDPFSGITLEEVEEINENVNQGGKWSPNNCTSRHKIAIIIPFRGREDQLPYLMSILHPMLQRQQLEYRIIVAEQAGNQIFNKGRLMNSAFLETQKLYNIDCVTFHDVDILPENDNNLYTCPSVPRHMSPAISRTNYKLLYDDLVGGVLQFKKDHFWRVNGYSNLYAGWGGEDDDMAERMKNVGFKVIRPSNELGRYYIMYHHGRVYNMERKTLLHKATKRQFFDGLNTVQYNLVSLRERPLFTHMLFNVDVDPLAWHFEGHIPRIRPDLDVKIDTKPSTKPQINMAANLNLKPQIKPEIAKTNAIPKPQVKSEIGSSNSNSKLQPKPENGKVSKAIEPLKITNGPAPPTGDRVKSNKIQKQVLNTQQPIVKQKLSAGKLTAQGVKSLKVKIT